ncbi:MAG: hypothetical protein KA978_27115 [Deltaproteobacteria bacterium]|nr:hypothetical protein [Deltaproteobacteria bacterium]
MTARASGAWVGLCSLAMFAASAEADPIPVLTVSVRDRGPTAAQVASVAGALGPEAQSGEALSRELLARFGRYAPQEDVLRPQREAIAAGETALFAQGRPAGRRRLQPALTAMEAAPDALELQENNRAAYLKGLFLMARIAHEDRRPEEAETWLRRAFAFDPWWMPSDYDCPLRFRPIVARLRPPSVASAPDASGTLSVRAPREGCTVSVDDARSPSTAQTVEQSLPARAHRVSLRCGEASRVRTVTVTAGRSTSLSLDPRLDALLRVAGLPGLNYPTAPESPAVVISDAAAVGSALGATRVVLLSGDRPMVVDVRRGELVHDEMSAQVERALGVGHGLPATVNQPPAVDPRVDVRPAPPSRGPGAGPWILMGAGVASLAAGGVLFYLRGAPLDTFERLCPDGDCGDSVSSEEQTAHDDASLYTTLSFVAGGVGVAAIAGGALWYALAPRRAEGTALRVTPWTTARSGGVSLHAQF